MSDSTKRFSDRVESYIKYRPSYPSDTLDSLEKITCNGKPITIADIGSGTGISTQLLLERGHTVFGVEPNTPMREAAEQQLSRYPNFRSVNGRSDATQLPDSSVDLIVAAQSFHWFELEPTKMEFVRILKPGGQLALIWNERLTDSSPFLREYEALLQTRATDYQTVNHSNITDEDIESFFQPNPIEIVRFPNQQLFDYEGLSGRCQSSSYVPAEGTAGHDSFFEGLREIFDRNAENGSVSFEYQTTLYIGHLEHFSYE
ncbi:class I SAM-dependent methyltransferase [Pelagicoccus mobilis]|uniref:Class I SAM-dependent methyltransferase n=1 Tax=Pelagicoccus mobilis TaxID=415221 RepID=A0A934VQ56_9BACT|nr:class I SAM-dependent methyltransferase [Pelagicoccus mobilis]MBK1876154.1 class I SAM-dependent methyltransferase [Pelagicoccus mobilis]